MPFTAATGNWYVTASNVTPVYSTGDVWYNWLNSNQTHSTGISNSVWLNWQSLGTTTALNGTYQGERYTWQPFVETPAQVQAREDRWARVRAERDAAVAAREAERAQVTERALELLALVLGPARMATYREKGHCDVRGSHGRRWRVHRGTSGNVRQLDELDREIAWLCAHPEMYDAERGDYLPTEDVVAAQVLALMTDEEAFIRKANVHRGQLRPA